MTSRIKIKSQVLATAAGLVLLVASSTAFAAPPSIAPFNLKIKSKIYTAAITGSGYFFAGHAAYVPGPVFSTASYGYIYGPNSAYIGATFDGQPVYPTYYRYTTYYFNPYWGAKHAPGISSGQAASGLNPFITNAVGTAVLASNSKPDFTVGANQMHWTGTGTVGPAGAYLGTTSTQTATNGPFNLGHGLGPGTQTFTACGLGTYCLKNFGNGKVKFTQGTDNPGGFGGTLNMLGGTKGEFLTTEMVCTGGATSCYHINLFTFPNQAVPTGLQGPQNQWTATAPTYIVNLFPTLPQTTMLSGTNLTGLTTFKATTGKMVMSQTGGSYPTIHTRTGSDNRTAGGVGNITLVTGWLGHTLPPTGTSHWGGNTVFKFEFFAASETPSLASPALGALGGLMAIAAVYVIRKRGSAN